MVTLHDHITFPFTDSPQPRGRVPTAAYYPASLWAHVQCTDVVTMAQEHCVSIVVWSFPGLSCFYYRILAAREYETFRKFGCWWVVCHSVDEGRAVGGYGGIINRRRGRYQLPQPNGRISRSRNYYIWIRIGHGANLKMRVKERVSSRRTWGLIALCGDRSGRSHCWGCSYIIAVALQTSGDLEVRHT